MAQVIGLFSKELIILLLGLKDSNIPIIKEVIIAVVKNRDNGKKIIVLLLN
jgi:hypothetical protein